MRRRPASFNWLLTAVVCLPCWLSASALGLPFDTALRRTLTKLPHKQTIAAASVIDATSGAVLFEFNADRPMVPASNAKVFVITTALAQLGPDFKFQTAFATDGTHLYIVGDGDPALGDAKVHEKYGETVLSPLKTWAQVLVVRGMTHVTGDIIIDESLFDTELLHPSWDPVDLGKWFAAPVSALNFNDNCIEFTVTPASQINELALITVNPPNRSVQLINKCRTGGSGKPILHHTPGTFDYIVKGRCSKRWPFGSVAFPDPALLTASAFKLAAASQGVTIDGAILRQRVRRADGSLPPSLAILALHESSLSDILTRIGKNSQNLFAECVLKRIGYEWAKQRGQSDPQGSWTLGSEAIMVLLKRAGVDTNHLVIADGSGLSRDNRCSANQLTATLRWGLTLPGGSVFKDYFSKAGVDGSLRKRLAKLKGQVYGKTGTMRGIRTLSGFVTSTSGRQYVFAVLFNGYHGPSTPYREIQDKFCRILATDNNSR